MPPFVVPSSSVNSAAAGSVTSTLPFVVLSFSSPLHFALPMDTWIPPFVVDAEAHSLVETSTLPFVVAASTTLARLCPSTFPFVVRAFKRTPRGTCTLKLILARFPCHHPEDSEETPPRWQRPGDLSLAYTAQIVTPSEYSTTSTNGSLSSSPPLHVPPARTSSPEAALASISPFLLMTSSVCPAFRCPCQWNSRSVNTARFSPCAQAGAEPASEITTTPIVPLIHHRAEFVRFMICLPPLAAKGKPRHFN